MIEIFILSLIQGVTEFIPISSSSHLILISDFLNFNNNNLSIDVSLHMGSFLAVTFYFKKDIFEFIENKKIFFKILIASIPVMFVGFILVRFNLIDQLRNIKIIGWTTLIFGFLLFYSDQYKNIKPYFSITPDIWGFKFTDYFKIPNFNKKNSVGNPVNDIDIMSFENLLEKGYDDSRENRKVLDEFFD